MANLSNSTLACIAMVGISIVASGCNPKDISDVALPIRGASESAGKLGPQTQVVKVANSADLVSPAIKANELPPADSGPKLVCQRFLYNLNRENADYFELLLTPAALNVISRHKFQLPPVAKPDSTVELSEPKYSTNLEKLCYIDCKIDKANGDEEPNNSMTWMLRKTSAGWRVAGMLVPESEPGTLNLLSFENDADIAQIKSSLIQDVGTAVIAR